MRMKMTIFISFMRKIRLITILAVLTVFGASCSRTTTCRVKGYSGNDIQTAIDRVHAKGGGVVIVPEGHYDVGSIQLKSNVELHLEKGAYLLGGSRSEDYYSFPEEICRIRPEGSSKVLLYAYDASDISITGEGTIDGQGPAFFDTAKEKNGYYPKPPVERPRMVQFVRCEDVRINGVTFKDSPCWTMLLRLCKDIKIEGISIEADQKMINNDGIDFDGCSHARVKDSRFKTCDDCIVLRAIREYPSQKVVCEDIVVENCRLDSRCQTIRLGCPSDDTIHDAYFTGIEASGNNGIFADFPTRYLSSGDEGYMDLHDIVFDGYRGSFTGSALQVVSQPGVKPRRVDGLVFRNFDVVSKHSIRFIGNPGYEIGSVTLEDFKAEIEAAGDPIIVSGCNHLNLDRVSVNGQPLG